jgi:hypothetical protein
MTRGDESRVRPRKQRDAPAKPDNPEQYRRFIETARASEADESPDALDRAFERVVGPKKAKDEPKKSPK